MNIDPSDAFIVVDVQNDFCPGGALPVKDGHRVVPIVNRLMPRFDRVVFTRDWHPFDHISFDAEPEFVDQSWPVHCVQDTPGAEFRSDLRTGLAAAIVSKGVDPDKEAYSGFEGTDLDSRLQRWGIRRIFIAGIAMDYCVKHTTLDARRLGYDVVVITDACRAVDVPAGSGAAALEVMAAAGAQLVTSKDLE
jgi:nicotinamidase/pyrazinamidase